MRQTFLPCGRFFFLYFPLFSTLQFLFRVTTGKWEEIEFLCSGMVKAKSFVPMF